MNIPFRPMLSAMSRHKATAFLLAAQIALTLAIVANAVFVIDQRVLLMLRPTGIDESNTVIVENRWVDELSPAQVQAKTAADLAMLRELPAVTDAYSDYSFPGAGPVAEVWGISLVPGQSKPLSYAERASQPRFCRGQGANGERPRWRRRRRFEASVRSEDWHLLAGHGINRSEYWESFAAAARAAGLSEQELFGRTSRAVIEFAASHGINETELIEIYKRRNDKAIEFALSMCHTTAAAKREMGIAQLERHPPKRVNVEKRAADVTSGANSQTVFSVH